MLDTKERELLLSIARTAISGRAHNLANITLPDSLHQKRSVFVTLTKEGKLRGCIGILKPELPLFQAVVQCVYDAAFSDVRFVPVMNDELKAITIEISILSQHQVLSYSSPDDLVQKLASHPGVVVRKDRRLAVYLPQVWKHLVSPEEFLCSLCEKAGLEKDAWRKCEVMVETFTVEEFSEQNYENSF